MNKNFREKSLKELLNPFVWGMIYFLITCLFISVAGLFLQIEFSKLILISFVMLFFIGIGTALTYMLWQLVKEKGDTIYPFKKKERKTLDMVDIKDDKKKTSKKRGPKNG